ncbi:MAG: family acetyltransferase [Sphingobacterium sp.]|jgi:hypothetical protein|nr:family acetyltransferase [Sphingobacterium sp.]
MIIREAEISDIKQIQIVLNSVTGYYRGFENASGELGCVLLPQFRGQGFYEVVKT